MSANRRCPAFSRGRLTRLVLASFVVAFALIGAPASSQATVVDGDVLDLGNLQALPDEKLSTLRGGFSIGGIDINLGVSMKASIQGAVFETNFLIVDGTIHQNWAFTGAGSDQAGIGTPPELTGMAGGQSIKVNPAGIGFLMTSVVGGNQVTQVMQKVDGGIMSNLLNIANGQVAAASIDLNVTIGGMQDIARMQQMSNMLSGYVQQINQLGLGSQ